MVKTKIGLEYKQEKMPDEEMEGVGIISPRQIKAYGERLPICRNVNIYHHEDGSRGAHCDHYVFGDCDENNNIKAGLNVSAKCYDCEYFSKRKDDDEIKILKGREF